MRTISVYETNEEVLIRATVRSVVVDNGTIKYQLRNKATGIDEKYLYTEEQIVPCEQPIPKTTTKKASTKNDRKTVDA